MRTINRSIPWFERKEFTSIFPASRLARDYCRPALAELLLWKHWNGV